MIIKMCKIASKCQKRVQGLLQQRKTCRVFFAVCSLDLAPSMMIDLLARAKITRFIASFSFWRKKNLEVQSWHTKKMSIKRYHVMILWKLVMFRKQIFCWLWTPVWHSGATGGNGWFQYDRECFFMFRICNRCLAVLHCSLSLLKLRILCCVTTKRKPWRWHLVSFKIPPGLALIFAKHPTYAHMKKRTMKSSRILI